MIERFHGGLKENTIDFSVNINSFINENIIKELVCKYCNKVIKYPEQRGHSLINVISNRYGISEDNIILGNGSIEIFYALPRALEIDNVITLEPTFSEYRYIAKINECSHNPVKPIFEFYWDFIKLRKKLNKKSLLFICNPNNPTGTLFKKEDILNLIDTSAFIVVDEAFMDFSEKDESLIKEAVKYKNLIVIKSLTKIYSIAGLRIGFCVASKNVIEKLDKILPLWNVNSLALSITKDFLLNKDLIPKTKSSLKTEKKFIIDGLKNIEDLKLFETYANFFLAHCSSTSKLISYLSRNNITVREHKGFYGLNERYFRFAIKSRRENNLLVKMINDFFSIESRNL
jgi:threonine-phosphate decarboxylase